MIQETKLEDLLSHIEEVQLLPLGTKELITQKKDGSFNIVGHRRTRTEVITYYVEIEKNDNLKIYQTDGYKIKLLKIGEISHTDVMGVDTAKLEQLMQKIDWMTVMPVDIRHDPRVSECLVQLAKISTRDSEEGMKISELLTLKYVEGTPLGMMFDFSNLRKQYEKNLFVELNGSDQDINVTDSYNIICGRGVAQPMQAGEDDKIYWLVEQDSKIIRVSDFNISGHLSALPFAERRSIVQTAQDLTKLCNGEQVEGRFNVDGQIFSAFYEADPINRQLAFRDLRQNRFDLKTIKESPERLAELVQQSKKPRKGLGL